MRQDQEPGRPGLVEVALGATGYTSHLLGATLQFLTEMLVIKVTSPQLDRVRDPDLYDTPLMSF